MKNIEEFKAGVFKQQYEYKSFCPTFINEEWLVTDPVITTLLDESNLLLGELNAYSRLIPDVDFFISMHIVKEATTSSRIEGTQTNIEEALINESDVDPEKRDDWQEVQNYVAAINFAIERQKTVPISNRLLKETHKVLMQGARGQHKQPGEFRTSQNWIGSSLKHATFIPPHHEEVPDLMTDLQQFIHNEEIYISHLVKIAIIHYQIETIHPFLDGNGRLGRLLIILYLANFKLLTKPSLYLSDYFERNKASYYDHLMAVRTTNNLVDWIRFFLIGVSETAANSIDVFKNILLLKEKIEREKLPTFSMARQKNVQILLQHLYANPVVSVKRVEELLKVRRNTAATLVKDFVNLEILVEMTGQKRNRLFIFGEYVKFFF